MQSLAVAVAVSAGIASLRLRLRSYNSKPSLPSPTAFPDGFPIAHPVERDGSDAARTRSWELAVMAGLEICATPQSELGLWGQTDGFVGSLHKQHGMLKHKLVATPLRPGTAKHHHHN
ncbi:plasma-membrane choline transporter family protein [Actinidia rufa]|uniref:Plasma-membrane choline transporter family protein n=1 Tax=Actinidia rufa TaxID=165716 RepID=A0A7J0FH79_9ERIC|nr:plasma-membrane choline transporter family protein [Actinidia rufa]